MTTNFAARDHCVPANRRASIASRSADDGLPLDGITTVSWLRAAGYSPQRIDIACSASGPWRRFGDAVVLSDQKPSRRQRLRIAQLRVGADMVITGVDALYLLGANVRHDDRPIRVLVGPNRRVKNDPWLVVERTQRMPATVDVAGLAVAYPARATIDAVRSSVDPLQIERVVLAALRAGLCELPELEAELGEGSQRGVAAPRRCLVELRTKLRSLSEQRARRLVASTQLPAPQWHVRICDEDGNLVTVATAQWPELKLCWDISVDGHRRAALARAGQRIVHTPPTRLLRDPGAVRHELHQAHRRAMADHGLFGSE